MAGSKTTAEVLSGAPNVAGYVFSAAIASTAPTDAATALDAAFINLGYIDDSGITIKQGSTITEIRDWNGDLVAALDDEVSASITMTLMQTGVSTMKEIYGDANVTVGVEVPTPLLKSVGFTGDPLPHKKYVWEMKNSRGLGRLLAEDGRITEVGDIKVVKKGVITYPVTVTLFRAPSGKFFERFFSWS